MRLTFLCSDPGHPVNMHLQAWAARNGSCHDICLARDKAELQGGDILFLISCSEIIHAADRQAYKACLVLHASDLPVGRGWSPHIWELVGGAEFITLSLLEAEEKVDSGRIWRKIRIPVPRDALWNEINERLFQAEIQLIDFAVDAFDRVAPTEQDGHVAPTYYRRRTPADSRVDPRRSIAEQFDLIRVCDPGRFPAFFELHGHRYKMILEKMDDQPD